MKIACFTDMHNMQTMLNLPTTLRQSAVRATKLVREEWGKADLLVIGGDNVSDYPEWNRSCALPYKNWLDIKGKMVDTFATAAQGERVLYVDGNNDLILGDLPTADNPPYNTCEFYETPMKQTLGVLTDGEKIGKFCKSKGAQAGEHLLAFHYVIDGVDFFGINIDPDTAFDSHEGIYAPEALAWLKAKLDAADPDGDKLMFVVGHLSATVLPVGIGADGTALREDMDAPRRAALYGAFAGHRNLFYLYGHVHGQRFVHRHTCTGVLHFDETGNVIAIPTEQADSRAVQGERGRSFTTVHMGGLRPFLEWSGNAPHAEYFIDDPVPGMIPGDTEEQVYPATGTPRLAQYLLIETYPDRVVFAYRNTGDYPGFAVTDLPAPYTVWLK